MSPHRNWDWNWASECSPSPRTAGGHTRLRVRGWGSQKVRRLEKRLSTLPTLWSLSSPSSAQSCHAWGVQPVLILSLSTLRTLKEPRSKIRCTHQIEAWRRVGFRPRHRSLRQPEDCSKPSTAMSSLYWIQNTNIFQIYFFKNNAKYKIKQIKKLCAKKLVLQSASCSQQKQHEMVLKVV